ncbi:MAG: SPFH domain-containing protein [Candidatus Bathyarchaeota archaeon]|jgi:regulator of protease activity HflC (stomatin/prohibitin superfamily)|nr:SPFH domain-containing protein [Candidatus Bathyarchaeota archaeon]
MVYEPPRFNPNPKVVFALVTVIVAALVFTAVFVLTMWVNVPVGSAVVMVDPLSGQISDPIMGPAWATKAPWVNAVEITVAVDTLGMWGDGYDRTADFPTVKSFSRDQLEMEIDITIRWRLDPSKIKQLYQNLPQKNWKEDIISSIAREQVRIVTKDFNTIQTIEQRDYVAQTMRDAIWNKISSSAPLAGAVTDFEFELRNIGYPATYTTAIEAKLVAEQQKIQADFERQIVVIEATATAEKITIEAAANANATVIEANATKEAIELVLEAAGADPNNSTRLAELYLTVQTLQQIAPDIDMLIMAPDGTPILLPSTNTQD